MALYREILKESKYFKYNGTWVLYILGLIGVILTLPQAVTSLMQLIQHGQVLYLFSTVSAWGLILSVIGAVCVGVKWIIHKENAKFSLIVGFLLAFLTLQILMAIVGIINSLILQQ